MKKNKKDNRLIDAVMNNQFTRVFLLLKYGVNPNACEDDMLFSPLHYAAAHSDLRIVILLLVAGASLESKDSHGDTPLDVAFLYDNREFTSLCRQYQVSNAF